MTKKDERTIEQQINDNMLYYIKEFKNKKVGEIIDFIDRLPPQSREYGYAISEKTILENKKPVFTIPELIIIAGTPKVLLHLPSMGYDLNKKYYKPTGTFFYGDDEYSFKEGHYSLVATFLNREDGHFQIQYLMKENYIKHSNEELMDCLINSFMRANLSLTLNNISTLLPDNSNINENLSDISFFKALFKLFSIKKDEGKIEYNHVFLYTQFFEFIYPYISFTDKDDSEQKTILSTLLNMEEYNHCQFYNRIMADFPQYKEELSSFMVKKLAGFLSYEDKNSEEKSIIRAPYHYISAIIKNPLIYLNESKNASLLNNKQVNVLLDQIFKHTAFYDYAYLLKNTKIFETYHIIEHINNSKNIDSILKEGLINYAYMNSINSGKKIDKADFVNPENFFFKNNTEGLDDIKRKLEKDLLGSHITIDTTESKPINRL